MGLAPPSLVEDKRALRRAMRDRREALSLDERVRRSSAAAARLAELPEFARATAVAGFMATASEIDPAPALNVVGRRGGTVAFPRVTMDQPRLRFHRVAGPDDLRVGAYGILEPRAECPEVAADQVDLFLIPGLAFDGAGGRL